MFSAPAAKIFSGADGFKKKHSFSRFFLGKSVRKWYNEGIVYS